MTISVEPAGTEAELATFLAIGGEVDSGAGPDVATLEHELATEPGRGSCSRSLDGAAVASGGRKAVEHR